jgi:hypothetical protein
VSCLAKCSFLDVTGMLPLNTATRAVRCRYASHRPTRPSQAWLVQIYAGTFEDPEVHTYVSASVIHPGSVHMARGHMSLAGSCCHGLSRRLCHKLLGLHVTSQLPLCGCASPCAGCWTEVLHFAGCERAAASRVELRQEAVPGQCWALYFAEASLFNRLHLFAAPRCYSGVWMASCNSERCTEAT